MRRSIRDVAAERQRTLFGVDRLERVVGDLCSEVIRLTQLCDSLCAHNDTEFVSRETHHGERIKAWLIQYEDAQKAEWNGIKSLGEVK